MNEIVDFFRSGTPVAILTIAAIVLLIIFLLLSILKIFANNLAKYLLTALKHVLLSPIYVVFVPLKWSDKHKRNNVDWKGGFLLLPPTLNIPMLFQLMWWILLFIFYLVYIPVFILIQIVMIPIRIIRAIRNRRERKEYIRERKTKIRG